MKVSYDQQEKEEKLRLGFQMGWLHILVLVINGVLPYTSIT